jgi:hypothetical protein
VETVAVSAVLIAYNWPTENDRYRRVKKFVEALFTKFDQFLEPSRHPKWRSVNLASTLPGWNRFDIAETLALTQAPTAAVTPTQASFEKFLEDKGPLTDDTPADRDKLFSEFLEWAGSRR